jgi:tetratricopeptide (TPR) repeat protein
VWSIICKISDRLDDAIEAARAATALAPNTGPLWNTLGDALLAAGRNSEAIDVLKRAISLVPNYSLALERLERAHLAHGDATLAVELRGARLRIAGRIERAGLLEAETGEFGAATAIRNDLRRELDSLLEQAATSDPFAEDWKRNVADRIAAGYAELGQWTDAMEWVQRIHDRRPGRLRRMLTEMPVDYRGLAVDPRYTRLMRVAGLEGLI